jgi:hypothetical protein
MYVLFFTINYHLSSNETAVDIDLFYAVKCFSHVAVRPEIEGKRNMYAGFYVTYNSKANIFNLHGESVDLTFSCTDMKMG